MLSGDVNPVIDQRESLHLHQAEYYVYVVILTLCFSLTKLLGLSWTNYYYIWKNFCNYLFFYFLLESSVRGLEEVWKSHSLALTLTAQCCHSWQRTVLQKTFLVFAVMENSFWSKHDILNNFKDNHDFFFLTKITFSFKMLITYHKKHPQMHGGVQIRFFHNCIRLLYCTRLLQDRLLGCV